MRNFNSLINEYGESHQKPTNKAIHWVCVPIIFWSITALLWAVKFAPVLNISLHLALIVILAIWIYYIRLYVNIAFGMLIFIIICI